MSDGYQRLQFFYENVSGTVTIGTEDTEVTAVPVNGSSNGALQTIFVQRGTITVLNQGAPGTTWTLSDDQSAFLTEDYPVGTEDPTTIAFDYGSTGRPLTEGAALVILANQAGSGGLVTFEGYRKLTGIGAV